MEALIASIEVDDAQAKGLFSENKDLFWQALKQDAQLVDQLISDYDFPKALEILKSVYLKFKKPV